MEFISEKINGSPRFMIRAVVELTTEKVEE